MCDRRPDEGEIGLMAMKRPELEAKISNFLSPVVIAGAAGFLVVLALLPKIAEIIRTQLQAALPPTWASVAAIALGVGATVFLIAQLPIFLIWFERKVAAHAQDRLGPMRVGWHGVLQSFADGIKLLFKEDIIPEGADRQLFRIAPVLVIMGAFAAFAVVPWGHGLVISDLNIGLLYIVAITSLGSIGILMAGWASNNKYSLYGGMRSAAQLVAYEIPTALVILVVVIQVGSLEPPGRHRRAVGRALGTEPLARHPDVRAEPHRVRDLLHLRSRGDQPQPLRHPGSGVGAGRRFPHRVQRNALRVLLPRRVRGDVAGGGCRRDPVPRRLGGSLFFSGPLVFFLKTLFLVFVQMWLRWTLPRLRVDQLLALCWKYLIPITLAVLVAVAGLSVRHA